MSIEQYADSYNGYEDLFDQQLYGAMAEQDLGQLGPQADPRQQAVLASMAYRGREAEDELLRRDDAGVIAPVDSYKLEFIRERRQEEQDKHIVDGLSRGLFVIGSDEDQHQLRNNANALARVRNSQWFSDSQKQSVIQAIAANNTAIRRNAVPVPPERIPQTREFLVQQQLAQMSPADREKYQGLITVGEDGEPKVLRGAQFSDDETMLTAPPDAERIPADESPVDENRRRPASEIPVITSADEYAKLPGGTLYRRGPDGQPMYKRLSAAEEFEKGTFTDKNGNRWQKVPSKYESRRYRQGRQIVERQVPVAWTYKLLEKSKDDVNARNDARMLQKEELSLADDIRIMNQNIAAEMAKFNTAKHLLPKSFKAGDTRTENRKPTELDSIRHEYELRKKYGFYDLQKQLHETRKKRQQSQGAETKAEGQPGGVESSRKQVSPDGKYVWTGSAWVPKE